MADLPGAEWRKREGLDRLLAALDAEADATRFVGGVVRDTLLGLPVADVDLATRIEPGEVVRRVTSAGLKAVPTGIAHGTVTAVLPGGPVEVTTLRRDVATNGRHAEVAFTDDWREDAARRDFTINALSARAGFGRDEGRVHDYFGGRGDLAAGIVRFIGDPLTRIAEDHLRILRFFRFQARFGRGEPDPAGLEACSARANDLMALSRERIADETLKLLAVADPAPTAAIMLAHDIWRPVLPEITGEGVARLAGLIAREAAVGITGDPLRRLAALLPPDPAVALDIAARLKLSKAARTRLAFAAEPDPPASLRALAYWVGAPAAIDRLLLRAADPTGADELEGWTRPTLPVGGGALVARGLTAGPIVAATLRRIEERWIAEDFPDAARVAEIVGDELARALVAGPG